MSTLNYYIKRNRERKIFFKKYKNLLDEEPKTGEILVYDKPRKICLAHTECVYDFKCQHPFIETNSNEKEYAFSKNQFEFRTNLFKKNSVECDHKVLKEMIEKLLILSC